MATVLLVPLINDDDDRLRWQVLARYLLQKSTVVRRAPAYLVQCKGIHPGYDAGCSASTF